MPKLIIGWQFSKEFAENELGIPVDDLPVEHDDENFKIGYYKTHDESVVFGHVISQGLIIELYMNNALTKLVMVTEKFNNYSMSLLKLVEPDVIQDLGTPSLIVI